MDSRLIKLIPVVKKFIGCMSWKVTFTAMLLCKCVTNITQTSSSLDSKQKTDITEHKQKVPGRETTQANISFSVFNQLVDRSFGFQLR